jgi:hypothetical protein
MNISVNNNSNLFMTPQHFLNLYEKIYKHDKDIGKFKEVALVLSIIFMLIGIVDNSISIYAFLQKKLLENSFNWYLLIVTIFKLIFCTTLFTDYIFNKVYYEHIFLHDLNRYATIIIDYIIHTSDSCIALLTVFLSLDRLYAIRHPLKGKDFFTNLHAKALIGISLFIFILFLISNTILCEYKPFSNFHIVYCTIAAPAIINTVPLVTIFIINVFLVRETIKKYYHSSHENKNSVKKSTTPLLNINEPRRRMSSISQTVQVHLKRRASSLCQSFRVDIDGNIIKQFLNNQKQKSYYFTIIILDIWSFLTSTPYYILNSYFILFHLNVLSIETLIILQILSSLFFNSNYCINFFIYLGFYGEFRAIVVNVFKKLSFLRRRNTKVYI